MGNKKSSLQGTLDNLSVSFGKTREHEKNEASNMADSKLASRMTTRYATHRVRPACRCMEPWHLPQSRHG